jgi:hypothetical protein
MMVIKDLAWKWDPKRLSIGFLEDGFNDLSFLGSDY